MPLRVFFRLCILDISDEAIANTPHVGKLAFEFTNFGRIAAVHSYELVSVVATKSSYKRLRKVLDVFLSHFFDSFRHDLIETVKEICPLCLLF